MVFWKEWREALRTLPIALVVIAIVDYINLPPRSNYVFPLANSYSYTMALWGSMYAIILALLQTWTVNVPRRRRKKIGADDD